MLREPPIGVAIIGGRNISNHCAAITKVGAIRLVGVAREGKNRQDLPPGVHIFSSYAEIIDNPHVQGLIFLTSATEREYWIEQGVLAGKHILCSLPPASNCGRTREIVKSCMSQGVYLSLYAGFDFPNHKATISSIIRKRKIGTFLYFDMKVVIPSAALLHEREGALLLYALPYLYFFHLFGEVDTIKAQTRSLGNNRPTENIAIVQIKFKNGLEGHFYLNGLGEREGVLINLHGSKGSIELRSDEYSSPEVLKSYYNEFAELAQRGGEPLFGGEEIASGQYYLDWLQKAARLDKEILRDEARIQ